MRKDAPPRTELGQRLRAMRMERSLQQQELAHSAAIHPMQYGRYERGDSVPTADVLKRLADALEVSGDYLLYGTSTGAAKANLEDRELLKLFEEVARFPEEDKRTLKNVIEAFVVRRKVHDITAS